MFTVWWSAAQAGTIFFMQNADIVQFDSRAMTETPITSVYFNSQSPGAYLAWEDAVVLSPFVLLRGSIACGGAGLDRPAALLVSVAPLLAAGGLAWWWRARDEASCAARMGQHLSGFTPGPVALAVMGVAAGDARGRAALPPRFWPMLGLGVGARRGSFWLLARPLRRFGPAEAGAVRP